MDMGAGHFPVSRPRGGCHSPGQAIRDTLAPLLQEGRQGDHLGGCHQDVVERVILYHLISS